MIECLWCGESFPDDEALAAHHKKEYEEYESAVREQAYDNYVDS